MNNIIFLILDLLGIAVISVLSFGLFPITDGVILSYIFLVIATLMQLVPAVLSHKLKDTAYKVGTYIVSGIYFIFQIIVSFLGYTLLNTSLLFIATTSIVLFVLNIVILFIIMQIGINGDRTKQRENTKAFFIDKAIYNLEKIKNQTKEAETITMLEGVIEKVRYSNLKSPAEAAETEAKIIQEIESTEKLISASKIREVKTSCEKLTALLSEREMLCKLYK